MQTIKSGSHSRLVTFEQCRFRAKLAYVERVPEPPRPLPAGKTEHPNDRGERVHKAAELYVQGGVELVQELDHFAPEFMQMRDLYGEGKVSLEGEWAFTKKWEPVAWMSSDVWLRVKCDAVVFLSPTHAAVIDYKTGKRYGNELKHEEQLQIYQLAAFIRYPKLEHITTELWYTDLNEIHSRSFRRDQGLRFVAGIEKRMERMTSETEFPPNPNAYNCRWCAYKPKDFGGTGHCSVGV